MSNKSFADGNGNNRGVKFTGPRFVKYGGADCGTNFGYILAFIVIYVGMMYFVFKLL
jgi:hypothetical protein